MSAMEIGAIVVSTLATAMTLGPVLLQVREARQKRAGARVTITIHEPNGSRTCTVARSTRSARDLRRDIQRVIEQAG